MGSGQNDDERESVRNQYVAAIVVNIIVFNHGCIVGWMSPVLSLLGDAARTPLGEPLTGPQSSLTASIMCLGGCLGTPFFGWTSDAMGRRRSCLLAAVPYMACWLLKLVGRSPATVLAARFLGGFGGGAVFVVAATYLVEVASPKTRGALGSLLVFSHNVGVVVMYAMGAYVEYRAVQAAALAMPVIFVATMFWMPETPVYLVRSGRREEAIKAIAWLRNVPQDHSAVRKELDALQFDIDLLKSESFGEELNESENNSNNKKTSSWKYLFCVRPTFKAFLVCFALLSVQSFVGVFVLVTYANQVFEEAGSSLPASINSIIVGCLQLLGSIVASSLIERSGRRMLLFISCGMNALCTFVIGMYFYLKETGHEVSSVSWIPVLALSTIVFTFAMGIGPVPYILPNELVPVQARALAGSIVLLWSWFTVFLIGLFFNAIIDSFGIYTLFWCFCANGLLGILIAWLFLPETKDKPLEQIMAFYGARERREREGNHS